MTSLNLFPMLKITPGVRRVFDRPMLATKNPGDLPRVIYMYWDSGFDTAPEICRICVASWRRLNPRWEVVLLDKDSAREYLSDESLPRGYQPQHFADLLRMHLLSRHGGVWADATLLCHRALDEWMMPLFNQTDIFLFAHPARDRLISNWFIAATPTSSAMAAFDRACSKYWAKRKSLPRNYFWHHSLVQFLALTSPAFRREFRSMPKVSADMCHIVQQSLNRGGPDESDLDRAAFAPVQKLTYKKGLTAERLHDIIRALQDRSGKRSSAPAS